MSVPRYTRFARQDYLDIAAYISRDNPGAAAKIVDRIEAECHLIVREPERGLRHDELSEDLYVRRVGAYLVIYQIDQLGPMILRIVHGARDLGSFFSES